MDSSILLLIGIAALALIALLLISFNSKKSKTKVERPARNIAEAVAAGPRNAQMVGGARRRAPNARLRTRNNQAADAHFDAEDMRHMNNDDSDDANDIDFEDEELVAAQREEMRKKLGTKKLAKLEEKQARRERNEEMLREREERKAREEELYQMRKKKEEEEEQREKEKEEEEKRLKEEQEKREHEEYLKLKEAFSVEEEGQDQNENEQDAANLLQEFVSFIEKSKIVYLDDLASQFKLKTQDVINRIKHVEEMGLLTGCMDDRGKYIYISKEELQNVKKFIEQRGRVNISELAKASGQLIHLQPATPVIANEIELSA